MQGTPKNLFDFGSYTFFHLRGLGTQHDKAGEAVMDWADTTTYLGGVIMQSNLKFDQPMPLKKAKASKILGAIKHILKQVPQKDWLLVYPS